MSTQSYSMDLRKRVIEYIKKGNTQKSASDIFGISTSAISIWWRRYKSGETLSPKKSPGKVRIVCLNELNQYMKSNGDQTLEEIGSFFKVSAVAIFKSLKLLGYSYKKNRIPMWRQMKKNVSRT